MVQPFNRRIIKNIVKESLRQEQGYICCYCERELENGDYHTEHLRPISIYPNEQINYNNLLCSCQLEIDKGEPRRCGNGKGNWYDDSLLVSPLDPDCESRFIYTVDGQIRPSDEADQAADTTIKKLQLNLDRLNNLRKNVIEPFLDPELSDSELELFVNSYLVEKDQNNGKYNQFYTTIKYLFAS